jgi:hypothetical protein
VTSIWERPGAVSPAFPLFPASYACLPVTRTTGCAPRSQTLRLVCRQFKSRVSTAGNVNGNGNGPHLTARDFWCIVGALFGGWGVPLCLEFVASTLPIKKGENWQPQSQCEDANKQTPPPLVRKRTIPTERPPLVEIYCQLLRIEGCCVVSAADPLLSLISVF